MTFEEVDATCGNIDLDYYTIYELMYMSAMKNFMDMDIAEIFYNAYISNVNVDVFGNGMKCGKGSWNYLRSVMKRTKLSYKK